MFKNEESHVPASCKHVQATLKRAEVKANRDGAEKEVVVGGAKLRYYDSLQFLL